MNLIRLTLFLFSSLAAGATRAHYWNQNHLLLKLESHVNNSVNSAIAALNPIFVSNPEFSNDIFRKIETFKDSLTDDLKHNTLSVINSGVNNASLINQLLKSWRKSVFRNLARFDRELILYGFPDRLNRKENLLQHLKRESLKLKNRMQRMGFEIKSQADGLHKRSLVENISKGVLFFIAAITTILGSWVILALYALSSTIGIILHFIVG